MENNFFFSCVPDLSQKEIANCFRKIISRVKHISIGKELKYSFEVLIGSFLELKLAWNLIT